MMIAPTRGTAHPCWQSPQPPVTTRPLAVRNRDDTLTRQRKRFINMLIAHNIAKSFPTRSGDLPILRDVSVQIGPGEGVAILGPSGSGKSTLLNILGTLERPTGGSLTLDDEDLLKLDEQALAQFRNTKVGFVFQDHHLMPTCSALENVLLPTIPRSPRPEDATRARELLDSVGLADRGDHRPPELSGGEKQRVALARALINEPRLVLADEPTGNLDRDTAEQVGELLENLPRSRDVILVVVTHSTTLAARFARRFALTDGCLHADS